MIHRRTLDVQQLKWGRRSLGGTNGSTRVERRRRRLQSRGRSLHRRAFRERGRYTVPVTDAPTPFDALQTHMQGRLSGHSRVSWDAFIFPFTAGPRD
jgi:hypothetical protein